MSGSESSNITKRVISCQFIGLRIRRLRTTTCINLFPFSLLVEDAYTLHVAEHSIFLSPP